MSKSLNTQVVPKVTMNIAIPKTIANMDYAVVINLKTAQGIMMIVTRQRGRNVTK